MKGVTERQVLRESGAAKDAVAVEEPLEIRVDGEPLAITMRTPGEDHRLALGFLFAEGVIKGAQDVGSVTHCGHPGDEGYGNVIDVIAAAGAKLSIERVETARRGTLTTAACGVCGRRSIDDLMARVVPVPAATVSREMVAHATEVLAQVQQNFASTGGVHAAAVLDFAGKVIASHEDVGRHNAVDKVVGALIQSSKIGQAAVLVVSGRSSFEIVQKAVMARIPVVASVSAASSLAIDLADKCGVALAAFARKGQFNLYTHPERLSVA